jgi:predicted small secreted protein
LSAGPPAPRGRFTCGSAKSRSIHVGFTGGWGFIVHADRQRRSRPNPHHVEEFPMKRMFALLMLVALSSVSLTACNTMSGMGKDIEAAGDKIDDKAQDCKDAKC